ncbi:hypothetical protein V7054_05100 [Priestia megaterium]|uniref:hypothetical protein n=1 Tax=Priestia megaterium TaxID=1404 RepID=UPI002FFE2768
MTEEKPQKKNIYKHQLEMDLIKFGNDLSYSMRNHERPQYQVFVFHEDAKLIRDMLCLAERYPINRK